MTTLRAVKAGEEAPPPPPPAKPMTVSQAAESGNERDLLVAMRARIAKAVQDETTSPRDLAALTRRLQDIAEKIAAIDTREREEAKETAEGADEDWDASAI